ncbi:MAG: GGDEF domain-containing protein [Clostridiales bacterium]|nr:GGDEF domain-containing protein [Clostridiales bacterium]MBR6484777.1 GGDEF domain-containing protein [Clostridiales bacterium]
MKYIKGFFTHIINTFKRLDRSGTWESEFDAGIAFGTVIFFAMAGVNFIAFMVSSLFVELPFTMLPWKMEPVQSALFWYFIIHTIFSTIIFTIFAVKLFDNTINTPVREINSKLYNLTKTDLPEYMVNGKLSNPFRNSDSKLTWHEKVIYYVDTASAEKYMDELTGCFNKKYFMQKFSSIMQTVRIADSHKKTSGPKTYDLDQYAVFMIDIDHFKKVNDDFGHAAGDDVLRDVGRLLRSTVGEGGVVIRNGGEEFVVVCSAKYPFDFSEVAIRINEAFRRNISINGRKITCSIGFVSFPFTHKDDFFLDIHDHVDLADMAMYVSKTHGRDQWNELKLVNEPPEKIDRRLFCNEIEYGLRRGFFVVRNAKGDFSNLDHME